MKIRTKAILWATAFSVVVVAVALFLENAYKNWSYEVTQTNKILCEVVAKQLNNTSQRIIDSLYNADYFSIGYLNSKEMNRVDRLLSTVSIKNLESIKGMEGGFYFAEPGQFQGYAYPTSPPPKPVYGPPPRSFNIIRDQILLSIEKDTAIVELHQFDPAIFPLATIPVISNGKVIGASWARIHIERELPAMHWGDLLNIAAVISVLGFIFAVIFSVRLRKRLEIIRSGLNTLEVKPAHRLNQQPGIFGDISSYINKMVDTLQAEHAEKEKLERELHQQDKMASLGKLIAGVAHEVKTPLAIIKTRIQMWQQKLKTTSDAEGKEELISDQSLQIVISEINRLANLVNRLLIFSKPIDENFKKADINALLNDLITLFKSQKYSEKAEITLNTESETIDAEIDANKIEQVVLNILTNSFESIKSEGLIEIKTKKVEDNVVIQISDNGAGISPEIKGNIFDPFFTTKGSGTGLGLSIAYEIIKAHKGKIEFTSEPGTGTIFTIVLPATQNTGE